MLFTPELSMFSLPIRKKTKTAILGVPFDSSQSVFAGARHGPLTIRFASTTLNDFSLLFRRRVSEFSISDWGDVEVVYGDFHKTQQLVHKALDLINAEKYLFLGGDHSITIMTVSYLHNRVETYVHVDADPDFEESYQGFRYSHGCTLRRVGEIIGFEKVILVGYRATLPEELKALEDFGVEAYSTYDIYEDESILKNAFKKADYLSLDLDVFDPAYVPEVGTPEPFGLTPQQFLRNIKYLQPKFVDIVELTTTRLNSITAVLAAGIAREILIAMNR